MIDLYNIPNDNHTDFRLKKFVEYQHEVPSIHYRFLGEFIKGLKLSKDEAVYLAWLLSVTYCEITCVLLYFVIKDKINFDYSNFWNMHKKNLIFGSAKMWNKRKDLFASLMENFNKITNGQYFYWLKNLTDDKPQANYLKIHNAITNIKNSSRLSADFFLEQIVYLKDYLGINVECPLILDWKNCANLTSGIYNIFYEDKKANDFDKFGKIENEQFLYKGLLIIQKQIQKMYPEQNSEIPSFIGKICSFRNLFKNARYAGFHHDRQLEWILTYKKLYPNLNILWDMCFKIRKNIFNHKYLGELHNWNGIRKERKKLWLKYGLTGAEN